MPARVVLLVLAVLATPAGLRAQRTHAAWAPVVSPKVRVLFTPRAGALLSCPAPARYSRVRNCTVSGLSG